MGDPLKTRCLELFGEGTQGTLVFLSHVLLPLRLSETPSTGVASQMCIGLELNLPFFCHINETPRHPQFCVSEILVDFGTIGTVCCCKVSLSHPRTAEQSPSSPCEPVFFLVRGAGFDLRHAVRWGNRGALAKDETQGTMGCQGCRREVARKGPRSLSSSLPSSNSTMGNTMEHFPLIWMIYGSYGKCSKYNSHNSQVYDIWLLY